MAPNTRARIQTYSGSWMELTVLMRNPKNDNWICVFDDGATAQYPESVLKPAPVETDTPLTPEVF